MHNRPQVITCGRLCIKKYVFYELKKLKRKKYYLQFKGVT
jgi:hypothetical protein